MPKDATPARALASHAPGLPDGIFIGLDEETYHSDSALGSTDIRTVRKGANEYWHRSSMNPKRPPVMAASTPARAVGKALHALLLEGEPKLKKYFVRRPADPAGATPSEKGAITKAANAKLMEGQTLLHGDDWDFITGVKDIIDSDPELKGCLDGGLSEVSVFWTRKDGVRMKVRFDKLKLRGIGDVKTIANERERELGTACRLDIHTYRYDIQAEHYLEGRRQLPALVTAGSVFDGNGEVILPGPHLKFLNDVAKQKDFAFQFVFVPKTGAPDAWSCVLSPGNPILSTARVDIETAVDYYKLALSRFGTKDRWLPMRAVEELAIEELPIGFGRN